MNINNILKLASILPMLCTAYASQRMNLPKNIIPSQVSVQIVNKSTPFMHFMKLNDRQVQASLMDDQGNADATYRNDIGDLFLDNGVAKIPYAYWAISQDFSQSKMVEGVCHGQLSEANQTNAFFYFYPGNNEVFPGVKKLECFTSFYGPKFNNQFYNEAGLPINPGQQQPWTQQGQQAQVNNTDVKQYRLTASLGGSGGLTNLKGRIKYLEIVSFHSGWRKHTDNLGIKITDLNVLDSEKIDLGKVSIMGKDQMNAKIRFTYTHAQEPKEQDCFFVGKMLNDSTQELLLILRDGNCHILPDKFDMRN